VRCSSPCGLGCQAVFRAAAVQQARDIGVTQGGQDLAFPLKTPQHVLAAGFRTHDLEGHLFAEGVVGTHGQIDGPHPSVADLAQDLVGAGPAGRDPYRADARPKEG
jgi:hypothetical protein